MDEFLNRFVPYIQNNKDSFIDSEFIRLPRNISIQQRVKSEFMRIHAFYHDHMINEVTYNINQNYVINEALTTIKELISIQDYVTAMYYIVSLQLLLGMEVYFTRIIVDMIDNSVSVSNFVDVELFKGFGKGSNGYGRKL